MELLYKPYKQNCFILEIKQGKDAQAFTGSPITTEVKICVKYPVKNRPGWFFFVECLDEGKHPVEFEMSLPKDEVNQVIGHIRSMNLPDLYEDTTDWTNVRCY